MPNSNGWKGVPSDEAKEILKENGYPESKLKSWTYEVDEEDYELRFVEVYMWMVKQSRPDFEWKKAKVEEVNIGGCGLYDPR